METISKKELLTALKAVKPGLASREVIEQTASIVFMNGRIVTYNDEVSVSHPINLDVEGAVSPRELYDILGKIKEDEIQVSTTKKELRLKAGRVEVGLSLVVEVLLPLGEITHGNEFQLLPDRFNEFAAMAAEVCADSTSAGKYSCVHFDKRGHINGTDNYRIVHCRPGGKLPMDLLVPAKSVKAALAISPTQISITKQWVHFSNADEVTVSCRTFSDTPDDVTQFIKVEEGVDITFPDTITETLKRATVFCRKGELDEEVEFEMTKRRMIVHAQSASGWFKEEVNFRNPGEEFKFRIKPYLLLSILKETNTCTISEKVIKFQGDRWVYVGSMKMI